MVDIIVDIVQYGIILFLAARVESMYADLLKLEEELQSKEYCLMEHIKDLTKKINSQQKESL